MLQSTAQLNDLLLQAQAGDGEALGELLEAARGYLRLLAQRELGCQLQARLDGSDLVQQTFASALENFENFEGNNIAVFLAWIQVINKRKVRDAIREHAGAGKRDQRRELPQGVDSQLFDPPATTSSPSQRLMDKEQSLQLAISMQAVTDEQREALRLRHIEGYSLAEIAEEMNRSRSAVAGLLARGLQELRRIMRETE